MCRSYRRHDVRMAMKNLKRILRLPFITGYLRGASISISVYLRRANSENADVLNIEFSVGDAFFTYVEDG